MKLEITFYKKKILPFFAFSFFLTGVTSVSAAPIEGALPIPIWRILTPGMPSTYDLPLNGQGWFLYLSEVFFYQPKNRCAYDRIRTCVMVGLSDSDPPLYDHGYLREASINTYCKC